MAHTERWWLGSASIALLLALSAAPDGAVAADAAPTVAPPAALAESPAAVFAERFAAAGGPGGGDRAPQPWRDAVVLIVLTGLCAMAAALYSAVAAQRPDARMRGRRG
jgi:hypothetical protein